MVVNKLVRTFKKHWITIWLIIAVISLTVVTSYAIYTRITIAKRVVSTQAGANSLFSSDHMNSTVLKVIEPVSDNSVDVEVPVNVFNYSYPKESVYRGDITEYDLIATIGTLGSNDSFTPLTGDDLAGLSSLNYKIVHNENNDTFVFGAGGNASHTFSGCSIVGGSAGNDLFTLTFDKIELGNAPNGYCIKLVAVPFNGDLPTLTGLVMVRFSKRASTGWTGSLEEIDESIEDDYDAYNYYLEGNGKGKLTFRWNSKYVRINPDFKNNSDYSFDGDITDIGNDISQLTINVDSSEINRYEIQFFKVDPKEYSYKKADVELYLPDTNPSDWVAD